MSSTTPKNEFIWSRQKDLLEKIEVAAQELVTKCLPDQLQLHLVEELIPEKYGDLAKRWFDVTCGAGTVVRFQVSVSGVDRDHYNVCQIEVLRHNYSPELFGKFLSSELVEERTIWNGVLQLDESVGWLKENELVSEQDIVSVYQDTLERYAGNSN